MGNNSNNQEPSDVASEHWGIVTAIPEALMREAHRIRSRLTWFWQDIFHLSEEEREQLTESCRWCLGEMGMRLEGPEEPVVTFCPKPCNLSICHRSCWLDLMRLHQKESARDSDHLGFQCFSCRDPVPPLVSHLYSSSERASGIPVLDHLPLCPWCRKFEQPIKHLLDCPELSSHFAGLSDGEIGGLLNLIPRLLNAPNPVGWTNLGVYNLERRTFIFRWNVRVAGVTRRLTLGMQPNMGSYDSKHMQKIFKCLFHVCAVAEEYLTPGTHPARRGELIQFHQNIFTIRQLGLAFPHQWCRGHGMCTSLLSKEAFAVFKAASRIVDLVTDNDWGIPGCINDRHGRSETPQCLHCSERLAGYEELVQHSLLTCHSGRDLLTLSVLARRVRNSLRRPIGREENGRHLVNNIPRLSGQLQPILETLRRAVRQHPAKTTTAKRFRSSNQSAR